LVALEGYTNVLAFGIELGIFVVFHITGLGSVDGVVASHGAVLAGEPVCASLAEYDVSWDDILFFVLSAPIHYPFLPSQCLQCIIQE
jgi:hypothetical protein